jgi:hypothetical protein
MIAREAGRSAALAALLALALAGVPASGQEAPPAPAWESYISAYGYFIPDEDDYLVPIVHTDRGRLHLEARWNYESADTGSIFAGWNFGAGESVKIEATAMVAALLGDLEGWAPAYRFTLEYRNLEVYSEGEYVFDSEDPEGDYFYNWSEVSYWPVESFRVGLVGQRTRLYQTELDIQRGILLGYAHGAFDLSAYVMNLDLDNPTVVISAGFAF